MMDKRIVIGIDTSNYTTSLALLTTDGELIANVKRLLPVKSGECGLRQSDAVFAHLKNIPIIMQQASPYLADCIPVAVGVSERPRNLDGSYMPCFLTGVAVAESLSKVLNVPLLRFSHQCGHVMAALYSSGEERLLGEVFAAIHVSGGTTELLRVKSAGRGFDAEIVGGTKDVNAGQVIDRIGVHLGLPFPCGRHLEQLARGYKGKIPKRKPSVDGTFINLSGLENMAKGLYASSGDAAMTAAFVFDYIGNSIALMCDGYVRLYGSAPFVFAGGVMCNSIIRNMLKERFEAYFAEPDMSADNAVGIAALTLRAIEA